MNRPSGGLRFPTICPSNVVQENYRSSSVEKIQRRLGSIRGSRRFSCVFTTESEAAGDSKCQFERTRPRPFSSLQVSFSLSIIAGWETWAARLTTSKSTPRPAEAAVRGPKQYDESQALLIHRDWSDALYVIPSGVNGSRECYICQAP